MEFNDVIRARHSVRAFTDQPVSDDQLQALLNLATTAPSWSNTQPYQIAIARGKVLESLRQELPPRFDKLAELQKASMVKKALAWFRKDGIPDGDFRPVVDYPEDLQPRRVATGRGFMSCWISVGRINRRVMNRCATTSGSSTRQWRFLYSSMKGWVFTVPWMQGSFCRI